MTNILQRYTDSELEALEKDALRYRWLKEYMCESGEKFHEVAFDIAHDKPKEDWDAAIDTAIRTTFPAETLRLAQEASERVAVSVPGNPINDWKLGEERPSPGYCGNWPCRLPKYHTGSCQSFGDAEKSSPPQMPKTP
jgi:hypothetical protein